MSNDEWLSLNLIEKQGVSFGSEFMIKYGSIFISRTQPLNHNKAHIFFLTFDHLDNRVPIYMIYAKRPLYQPHSTKNYKLG